MSTVPFAQDSSLNQPQYRRFEYCRDLTEIPNQIIVCPTQDSQRAVNRSYLAVNETLGRRVKLKFDWEVFIKYRGKSVYRRTQGNAILLSAPNAEQAELFIAAVQRFAADLQGKWLAPAPTEPPAESTDKTVNSTAEK